MILCIFLQEANFYPLINDFNRKETVNQEISESNCKETVNQEISEPNRKETVEPEISEPNRKETVTPEISHDFHPKEIINREISTVYDMHRESKILGNILIFAVCMYLFSFVSYT